MKTRSIRDPLHGFIELTQSEWEVVHARAFQRLRDIHQLGMGHMVYPGANHTRFEHSLGCVNVSSRMFDTLMSEPTSRKLWDEIAVTSDVGRYRTILRLASLLHDIGHAPYSHTGEHLFIPKDHDASDRWAKKKYSHEHMTARLIRETELSKLISNCGVDPEEVVFVATEPARSSLPDKAQRLDLELLNSILTGELGSDRCDYLLRDAYHSGQPAGAFDLQRLVQQLRLVEHNGAVYLGLNSGGWIAAEQMIANRYAAYVNLYFHKAKRAYEQHLIRFLEAWLSDGRFPQDAQSFMSLSDSVVWAAMTRAAADAGAGGHTDARVFFSRQHFKPVFERTLADLIVTRNGADVRVVTPEACESFAISVREAFDSSVFVDTMDHSATKIRQAPHRILVSLKQGTRYLDELSEIVRGMNNRIWRFRVHATPSKSEQVARWCELRWQQMAQALEAKG
jgi:HD superfamily phosphohydrolase